MAMWPTLGMDDSEQALFAQHFAWSYRFRAPPLFTWMLIGLGKALGVDILAISIIRYLLLGVVFGFAYATARRLISDPRLSALSLYSFGAIYMFAFYSHHDFTHTTAMSAMLALAWYVFVRLAAAPRLGPNLGWYIALGAVFGLGLLGKWNFVMFAAALPLTCLLFRDYRRLVLTWRILAAVAACGLVVLPTVAAALLMGPDPQDSLQAVLVGDAASYAARVAEGTLRLAASALVYPQPLLPLVVLVFATALWRGIRRIRSAPRSDASEPAPPVSLEFLLTTIAVSLALHLVLVLGFGAREFHERLMQPPLFILPVVLFMLIERGGPSRRAVNVFAVLMAVLVAGTLAARIGVYAIGADYCGRCRNMVPFGALADDLGAAGYSGKGTIVADGFPTGGNMRVAFPDARIVEAGYPSRTWPAPKDDGPCLLVWDYRNPTHSEAALAWLHDYLASELHRSPDAPHRSGVLSEPMFGSATRRYQLGYELYEGPVGDCR